ncbi:E3 SUMO-protein ligase CBX4 isoform X2 [Ascaphus truei]|uniref:E3 SUMO-protein ligase CBX4 isoform X2 n=1 Tax=Ascaphus truei TaxID=8439 RepID=UPI003F5942DE
MTPILSLYNTWEPEENILDPRLLIAFQNRERQEQIMGYRKRGPKPKHHLVPLPSFARRSNVLSGLQDSSMESRTKLDLGSIAKSQPHQYQLNSKKHHQYQPNGKDHSVKHHSSSKRKYYYQLNSKKHHHYQPDPKMYDQYPPGKDPKICVDRSSKHRDSWAHSQSIDMGSPGTAVNGFEKNGLPHVVSSPSKEVSGNGIGSKMKIVKNKNKNGRIVIVMSKYMENGMQSVKIKSSEEECDKGEQGRRAETPGGSAGDRTCKATEEKPEHWKKRAESKIMINEGKGQGGADRATVPLAGLRRTYSTTDHPHDQPLQLTTKKDLIPWSTEANHRLFREQPPKDVVYGNPRKRCLTDTTGDRESCKKMLTSRSVSAPGRLDIQARQVPVTVTSQDPDIILLDSDLDEPIDLRCVKSRCDSDRETDKDEVQVTEASQTIDVEAVTQQPLTEFKPFFGNIVITDVTANCLTVTFKEYITV